MMKCAAGCVNKLAFLTEAGQHRPGWSGRDTQSGAAAVASPPAEAAPGGFFLTAPGGDGDFSLSPLIPASRWNQSGWGSGGGLGWLVDKKDVSPIRKSAAAAASAAEEEEEEIFLMKCNTLANCYAALRILKAGGRARLHFKCSISQLRARGVARGAAGRGDQSL